nr:MAG TPA: hypothetical protein [Caudoviricetes sp.]
MSGTLEHPAQLVEQLTSFCWGGSERGHCLLRS